MGGKDRGVTIRSARNPAPIATSICKKYGNTVKLARESIGTTNLQERKGVGGGGGRESIRKRLIHERKKGERDGIHNRQGTMHHSCMHM
jgi:hypothetical protein